MLRSAGWILLVWLTAPAAAQEPNDFRQLGEAIAPGDNIRVTLSSGRLTPARVVDITPSRLSVRVDDNASTSARATFWTCAIGWPTQPATASGAGPWSARAPSRCGIQNLQRGGLRPQLHRLRDDRRHLRVGGRPHRARRG